MQEEKIINFALQGIKTEQFAIFSEYLNEKENAQLDYSFEFMSNHSTQQFGIGTHFTFKQQGHVIIKLVVVTHFKIEASSWENMIEGDRVKFPKDFLMHLIMLSVGSARGVLAAKTENSPFTQYIIPLLDLRKAIPEELSFDLDS